MCVCVPEHNIILLYNNTSSIRHHQLFYRGGTHNNIMETAHSCTHTVVVRGRFLFFFWQGHTRAWLLFTIIIISDDDDEFWKNDFVVFTQLFTYIFLFQLHAQDLFLYYYYIYIIVCNDELWGIMDVTTFINLKAMR